MMPPGALPETMTDLERLEGLLGETKGCLLAYSGGVDSTFLMAVARRVLGEGLLAITVHSLFHEESEIEDARERAASLGVCHEVLAVGSKGLEEALGNSSERCYHCKRGIFELLKERASREGFSTVIEASHLDDLGERRPGIRALEELAVRSPLREAGFTKARIRECSHQLGVEGGERHSRPCLATRIPYGTTVTAEALGRIGAAEKVLSELGFPSPRVRDYGATARIELRAGGVERMGDEKIRESVISALRELGYIYVTVDLMGYRSGSMDEVL
jgi:uncharacterized protein